MRLSSELLETDLYALLGVCESANWHEIRSNYRRLARESHPDINPNDPSAVRRMAELNVAARVLLDPVERTAYDHARRMRSTPRPQSTGWYEHVSVESSDWASPEPVPAYADGAGEPQSGEFRQRYGRTALLVQHKLFAMSNERRIRLAALCLAIGWGLISFAHPSNAFWLPPAGAQAFSTLK